jgi:serine/threonine-protein kinase
MAFHRKGQPDEARKTLASAILSYDWTANQVRDIHGCICHILRREAEGTILPKMQSFLDGNYMPQDNDERLALLGVCQFTNRTCAAARLYSDAFASDVKLAEDINAGHRYNAARAAALAGCGLGADAARIDEAERTRWRCEARDWLRADLAAWAMPIDRGSRADRAPVRKMLTQWQADPELAGLRELGALEKLSVEERVEWLALWKEVDALRNRATSP